MLEYWDRHREPNGDEWFTVTTILHDPKYYMQDFITSTHFKKEAGCLEVASDALHGFVVVGHWSLVVSR